MHSNESGVPVDQHADYRGRCVCLESRGCVSCSSRASITDTIFNATKHQHMVVELITGWMDSLFYKHQHAIKNETYNMS